MTERRPLRRVIAWNLTRPCPTIALLECGHFVRHSAWTGESQFGAPVSPYLAKIRAREAREQLPHRKRCPQCADAAPLFDRVSPP